MITRIANYDMLLVQVWRKKTRMIPVSNIIEREKTKGDKSWKYLKGSLKSIREAIKDVAKAIREGNVIAERGQPRVYSEQELFAELVNIGHIFSLLQTLGPLFGCTAEGRKEFLLQMMHNSSGDLAY
ncbi:hypothetical protein Goklo_011155 [Gossypium klotzschianum]|uniref:Uncharacterized protein n=1 Tax=Gossypium klotzschianum TaxID=34286 RepID=A0A7J8V858_9ROSI|nr:hypothetical protein [Gossypium klotzschianum]